MSVFAAYAVFKQWTNLQGARIATFLFACHPVHVEAVTSVVGRADSLCGLFYCLSLYSYAGGVRLQTSSPVHGTFLTALAYLCAALATLSKEVGFTVVALFVVIEVVENLKKHQSCKDATSITNTMQAAVSAIISCFKSVTFYVRMFVLIVLCLLYFHSRTALHGSNMLYKWTIMENHVHHLPGFKERALSYAQYHALYLWKLIYPAQLCFDYGYACVPTIHRWLDPMNLNPLLAYSAILALIMYTISQWRLTLLLGLALLIVPLTPALNIFVPVGVLVAERLLFIPSLGFCLLVAELLTVDVVHALALIWGDNISPSSQVNQNQKEEHCSNKTTVETTEISTAQPILIQNTPRRSKKVSFSVSSSGKLKQQQHQEHKHKQQEVAIGQHTKTETGNDFPVRSKTKAIKIAESNGGKFDHTSRTQWILSFLVLPVLALYSYRVVIRNADWHDEYSLYKSGLNVCPHSLKVLTNFALLSMSRGDIEGGLDAALRAVSIYPEQMAALINAGVAYQKLERYADSIDMFQRCLKVNPDMSKANGYIGVSYYHWAVTQSDASAAKMLRLEALKYFNKAINLGFQAPMILHLTGSTLIDLSRKEEIDLNRKEESVMYYEAALQQSSNYASYYSNKGVHVEPIRECVLVTPRGGEGGGYIRERPKNSANNLALLTNLGNIYRELGDVDRARVMMSEGIAKSGEYVPPALINNLGLLELNAGNFQIAQGHFQHALRALSADKTSGVGESVGADGTEAE
eukprot:CAMPEP_0170361990 /NCGR_PEP_ID=MMETSP0117_2-20130122/4095_1 /TAXON_ID=400756 /ORGANISM="Durinskia baltica, Strain CSIRO CS-38" /LENGTH=748 /DNA_ID=CAMNT_0010616381 /DNA_START=313 /DNA_END=2557 /DNA_ORIENTATION=-